jgi:hypothetical protein
MYIVDRSELIAKVPKNPSMSVSIKRASTSDIEAIGSKALSVIKKIDPLYTVFDLDDEKFLNGYILPMIQSSFNQNLLFKVQEGSNHNLIGFVAFTDLYQKENKHNVWKFGINTIDRFVEYIDEEVLLKHANPSRPFEMIWTDMGVVDPQYIKYGIGGIVLETLYTRDPIISKATVFGDPLAEGLKSTLKRVGFQNIWEKEYKDFKSVEGLERYSMIPEISLNIGYPQGFYKNYSIWMLYRAPMPKL